MNQNNKTILIVEDEKPLLDAIKIKLEKRGFTTVTARTVVEAKKYVEGYAPCWQEKTLIVECPKGLSYKN